MLLSTHPPRRWLLHGLICIVWIMFVGKLSADSSNQTVLERIAFGSCVNQNKPQPIWRSILNTSPDLFLLIGDNVYVDSPEPARIRRAYRQLGREPGYRALREHCSILATWDDHDYGVDDGGQEHPHKGDAQRAFLEFFAVPRSSLRWSRDGVYHAAEFGPVGKRIQIILLDTRYHRGPLSKLTLAGRTVYLPNENSKSTMLGEQQWAWLQERLSRPAELHLLVSSIQVLPTDHPFEKWGNLPLQRTRLLRLLRENTNGAVLILSGDQHFAEFSRMRFNGFDFWEVTSSGMTHNRGSLIAPNRFRVGQELIANNFGMLEIDWSLQDPPITMTIFDETGEQRLKHQQRLSSLAPRHER